MLQNEYVMETLSSPDHSKRILYSLHELYVGQRLCDFTLTVNHLSIHLHKSMLLAASSLFQSLSDSALKSGRYSLQSK